MRFDRPLTHVLSALIVVMAWLAAVYNGADAVGLATAGAITLLCAAIILHYVRPLGFARGRAWPSVRGSQSRRTQGNGRRTAGEAAAFRRSVFNLCAALKLGVRFCEDHMDSEPEVLVEQLHRMSDNIRALVDDPMRPAPFYQRPRTRWPWRATPQSRTR